MSKKVVNDDEDDEDAHQQQQQHKDQYGYNTESIMFPLSWDRQQQLILE